MKKQLNTNYRLVWSAVQNALIAVSELTHAKVRKQRVS
ncbi:ESPR-type extended signal peptide-containing protein [Providencia sp. VP23HZSY-1]